MDKSVTGQINVKSTVVTCTQEYEWIIDYERISNIDSEEWILSPVFTIANTYKWQLSLYPKGNLEKYKNFYSIFLNLLSDAVELKVKASFEIFNNTSKEAIVKRTFDEIMNSTDLDSQGYPKFVNRNLIEKYLPHDGAIKIACKIVLTDKNGKESNVQRIDADRELQQLSTDFEQLIDDKEFNDVEFTINGKELRANKSILGKRSRVFSAMLDNIGEKRAKKVEITDIRHEIFLEMLRYIYCGKVYGIDTIVDELLAAADKYSLDGLKLMCARSLSCKINADNALNTLRLADQYSFNSLKARTIDFIITQAADIVDKPEFRELPYNIVCDVCSAMIQKKK